MQPRTIYLIFLDYSSLVYVLSDIITPRTVPKSLAYVTHEKPWFLYDIVTSKGQFVYEPKTISVASVTHEKPWFLYVEAHILTSLMSCLSGIHRAHSFHCMWNTVVKCSSTCQKYKRMLATTCSPLKVFDFTKAKITDIRMPPHHPFFRTVTSELLANINSSLGFTKVKSMFMNQLVWADSCPVKFPQYFVMDSAHMLRGLAYSFQTHISLRINVTFLHFDLMYKYEAAQFFNMNVSCYSDLRNFRNCFLVRRFQYFCLLFCLCLCLCLRRSNAHICLLDWIFPRLVETMFNQKGHGSNSTTIFGMWVGKIRMTLTLKQMNPVEATAT